MVLICDNCGFIFSRSEETEQCSDCGKYEVHPANEVEQEEFTAHMAELIREECAEAPKEQVNRVFGALNDNDSFKVKLFDFVTEQLEQAL